MGGSGKPRPAESADPLDALDEPFVREVVNRLADRVSRNAELGAELALRGKLFPRREHTLIDPASDPGSNDLMLLHVIIALMVQVVHYSLGIVKIQTP